MSTLRNLITDRLLPCGASCLALAAAGALAADGLGFALPLALKTALGAAGAVGCVAAALLLIRAHAAQGRRTSEFVDALTRITPDRFAGDIDQQLPTVAENSRDAPLVELR
ncbi:MAG: hypothetical protein KDA41_06005, partial [Planctomycetales bacterium]|nr:hypothetical protein [Planctomycetales bacterium]